VSDAVPTVGPATQRRFISRSLVNGIFLLGILLILAGIALEPRPGGIRQVPINSAIQIGRQIGMMMFEYATDNDGNYPDGKSSTEVFQKLLDGGYCTDPTIFYISLSGKTKSLPGQKLKPENVCWDVTSSLNQNSPSGLPLVFMTGYKVNYVPGGTAVPLVKPYPPFWTRTWLGWLRGEPEPPRNVNTLDPGIAAFYIGNLAKFMKFNTTVNSEGSIPNFISPDFKPDGKTYRQLTPDGPLP